MSAHENIKSYPALKGRSEKSCSFLVLEALRRAKRAVFLERETLVLVFLVWSTVDYNIHLYVLYRLPVGFKDPSSGEIVVFCLFRSSRFHDLNLK